jgi:DhnA family fructose-bisphosphate aldolase class Ia
MFDLQNYLCSASTGKKRRLRRLFSSASGRVVIVPVDDSLIFGPSGGLEQLPIKLAKILEDPPDGVLAFFGAFRAHHDLLAKVAGIVNLTASTSRSQHTRKVQVGTLELALRLGMEAVAVHVNITSKFEPEMLRTLGNVSNECDAWGVPLLAIMYPRSEDTNGDNNYDDVKNKDRKRYAELVAHAARVGVDLGADIIKTKYTGDPESFHSVVEACKPIPIVVAGGPTLPMKAMLSMAYEVVSAGGAGVSFGRNIFSRSNPRPYLKALKAIVHEGASLKQTLSRLGKSESE